MSKPRITVEEWHAKSGFQIPGWGEPNPSHDPEAYAAWCDRENVINKYAHLLKGGN